MSSEQRRQQIPADMNSFNAKVIEEFRANQGRLGGQLAGSQLLLLTTKGVSSGAQRTAVVGYRRHGDAYAIIASNNAAPRPPHWFFNLMAGPVAIVEVGAEKFEVRARIARPDERPELARKIDYLEGQQARIEREIPIVLLERVSAEVPG